MTLVTESRSVLQMRWSEFDRLTDERGWHTDAERARQLGISDRVLSHMRVGRTRPGLKVVDRCLAVFGKDAYDVLFERVPEVAGDAA